MVPTARFIPGAQPFPRKRLSLCLLAGLLLPGAAQAQVSYTGTAANQNFGSQAIGSTSAAKTFRFSIAAGTTVGSIGVVTQGAPNLDFANATGGTCTAMTYASASTCTVNVTFTPKFAGLRMGAVVFFSAVGNTGTVLGSVLVGGNATGPQISFGPVAEFSISNAACVPQTPPTPCLPPWPQDFAVAVDGAGDLFFSDPAFNVVYEVPVSGLTNQNNGPFIQISPTVDGAGLNNPCGLAVDGAGNLYIGDQNNGRVVEVPTGGGSATAIAPAVNGNALAGPCGLTFDAAGDLFISDTGNNRVVEVPAGGGAATAMDPTVNGEALSSPNYAAVDGAGDLFISDAGNGRVVKVPAGGGAATAIDPTVNGTALSGPAGVAVDGAGNLYIVDQIGPYSGRVVDVPAGGGAPFAVPNLQVATPVGVAVDGAGDLFVADGNPNTNWVWVAQRARQQQPALNFPAVTNIGSIDTTDGTQTVQLQNIGNEALALTLSYPADFPDGTGVSNACPVSTSLGAGQACAVAVEFAPQNAGVLSENVTLTDNAPNAGSKQSIGVSGASAPAAYATHFSMTTTASVVAGDPFSLPVTALNSANATATGYNGTVTFTSSDPGFVNPGALTLSSGVGQATVTMGTAGTQTITATDSAISYVTSTASFAVAPAPLGLAIYTGAAATQNFGSQAIGTTSAVRTLSFNVLGGATVGSIGGVVLGSPNLDFGVAPGSNCAVQDFTSPTTCTVNVTFTPKAPGLRMGALAFFSGPNSTGTVVGSVPIYGVGTGPLLAFGFGQPLVIAAGYSGPDVGYGGIYAPTGLATDAAGDVFINYCCGVLELPAGGGSVSAASVSGTGLAVDGVGNLFIMGVGGGYGGAVVEVPVGGGSYSGIDPTVNNLGLSGATGMTVDATGDLFIADTGNNRVVEVPAGGRAALAIKPTVGGKGLSGPTDVKLDAAGDLFIADQGNNRVVKVPAGGGAAIAIAGVGTPYALALDVLSDLFVLGYNSASVMEVPAGGGAAFQAVSLWDYSCIPVVAGLLDTAGIATDGAGDLFVSTFSVWSYYDPGYNPPYVNDYYSYVCEFPRSQPPAVNFPTATNVGSIDTTDGTQTVQIQNLGNQALNLAALSYPADFPEASGDPNPCPVSISLSAGQSCDIPIEFAPKQIGALSQDVKFTENSLNVTGTQQSILVSGTGVGVQEALTSPTPGSTLTGSSATFTWTAGTGATAYNLWLGLNGTGSSDLYNSGVTTATSATVSNLPTTGATIYARLFWLIGSGWHSTDYTYTEATAVLAAITSPTPGTTLGTSNVHFTWTAGLGVTSYNLWLGLNGVGSSNLYNSGILTGTSAIVPTLPTKGGTIFARLYSDVGGRWESTDYTYTAATGALAAITSPSPGTTLGTSNVVFTWTAGVGVTHYNLWVGLNGVGSSDLYNSGSITNTTATVPKLPASGVALYVRLYSDVGGEWESTDYTYTER
jgi:sugar lactone lactonase YvrE